MKATISNDSALFWGEIVKKQLDNGGKLLVSITHTSRSNLSYRYKVKLAYWDTESQQVQFYNLGYWLASQIGANLTNQSELKGNGVGFCRYFEAALDVAFALKKLGLAGDRYEYEIKYQQI
jgi:hypothetical protein